MSTATRLNLSIKETPQSISVITRQQMDDFNLNTLTDVLRQTTGINVQHNDSDRVSYSSRGYRSTISRSTGCSIPSGT